MSPAVERMIAAMAAKDEGYGLDNPNNSIYDLIGPDGTGMFKGYYNMAVEVAPDVPVGTVFAPDMALNLAIRKKTADVVDIYTCTIFRYPDLMRFRHQWIKKTGAKPVTLDQISDEVDCPYLKIKLRSKGG
jgi:hypothetical protein